MQSADDDRRTFIVVVVVVVHEVVLFNKLRQQYTASKQQQSAADNERLWVSSLTLLPSPTRYQFIHNEANTISKYDLRTVLWC